MLLKPIDALLFVCLVITATEVAHANNLITNGGFDDGFLDPHYRLKEPFNDIKPIGWSGGDALVLISAPGFADVSGSGLLTVWGPFPATSPQGGFFVMAVGDPNHRASIYQTLTGLTPGQAYAVSFYQAAGQAIPETDPTTERWLVSFGGTTKASDKFSLPGKGIGPWEQQRLEFRADASTLTISFLADGTPIGAPPVSFLDGITVSQVPEPTSLMLTSLGLIGFGMLRLRRRAQENS